VASTYFFTHEGLNVEAIIQHLKICGEQLDTEIAAALNLSLDQVRTAVKSLSDKGTVMSCFVTRYHGGEKVEGWICRTSGFIPQAAPGRKSGAPKA